MSFLLTPSALLLRAGSHLDVCLYEVHRVHDKARCERGHRAIGYADWLQRCLSAWHVSSEQVFRAILTELLDHAIVRPLEDYDDVRMCSFDIPFAAETLGRILSAI